MEIRFDQKVAVPAEVLTQLVQGELVSLNVATGSYYGLDGIGTRMWELLTQSSSIGAAYDTLLEEYDVEPQRLRQDLCNLLEKLVEHGLVKLENSP